MRVLFVSGEFPPHVGGVGDYTDRLAGALADQGEAVSVFTGATLPAPDAVNSDAVWAGRPDAVVRRAVRRWTLRAWRPLAAAIRAERPDVVHVQYQAAAYGNRGAVALFPWLLRGWNIRPLCVVTFHDLRPPHLFPLSGRLGLDRRAVPLLARGADAAVATNGDDAAALSGWRARRVEQIPIGANIEPPASPADRTATRSALGVTGDAPLLAYFGFSNASKGLDELFAAVARLSERFPSLRLLLIGGGTGQTDATNAGYHAHLRQRAAALGIGDRLIWTGYEDAANVSAQLLAADVVVLPFRDGVSLRRGTLLAALAHGCAIVTTAPAQPIPDLAAHAALRLYPAGDVAALVVAITESLQPAQQERLRAGARAAADAFRWPAIAAAHRALYLALCRQSDT